MFQLSYRNMLLNVGSQISARDLLSSVSVLIHGKFLHYLQETFRLTQNIHIQRVDKACFQILKGKRI